MIKIDLCIKAHSQTIRFRNMKRMSELMTRIWDITSIGNIIMYQEDWNILLERLGPQQFQQSEMSNLSKSYIMAKYVNQK